MVPTLLITRTFSLVFFICLITTQTPTTQTPTNYYKIRRIFWNTLYYLNSNKIFPNPFVLRIVDSNPVSISSQEWRAKQDFRFLKKDLRFLAVIGQLHQPYDFKIKNHSKIGLWTFVGDFCGFGKRSRTRRPEAKG